MTGGRGCLAADDVIFYHQFGLTMFRHRLILPHSCIYKECTIIIMYNLYTSTFIFFLFYAVVVGYVFAC